MAEDVFVLNNENNMILIDLVRSKFLIKSDFAPRQA
jgi:hypothetical protein